MFVELLTRVLDGGAAPAASSSSDDDDADAASAEVDFYAVLRTAEAEATSSLADAHFEVVQANDFKNLMHLSLRMRAADDVATARNLAARLALQRERNAELRNEAQQKDAALAVLQEERASAVEELEVLQRQQGNSQRALRLEHGEEINGLRRTADEDREAMRVQHSEESRAAAAASEAKLEAERARSAELQDRHDEFAATSARIQTELRQESARAAATEAEMERLVMQAHADQEHRDALDHQRWVEEEST
jgi:spindle assembly abnormal protein 6